MQRAVLYIVTGCVVLAATTFLTAYTALTAFTDRDWPDL